MIAVAPKPAVSAGEVASRLAQPDGNGTMSAAANILLVMTDQQRADSLGCYGGQAVATPHLDRLAAEGVVFDRAYCTNPICTPSRASLMTGHHLPRHGVYRLQDALDPRQVMFPERLRERGYQTALIGKLHAQAGGIEARQRHPHDGFDRYELYYGGGAMMDSPLNGYAEWVRERRPDVFARLVEHEKHAGPIPLEAHMNTWAAERSEAFLRQRDDRRPFFLMVSVFDPHNPYDDHPPSAEARVDRSRLGALIPPSPRDTLPEAVGRERDDNYFGDFAAFGAERIQAMRVGYHAEVGLIDDLVGRLLASLETAGVADETLVLFVSDHGDMLGDHGLMVKGAVWYDANVRVPAIVRWPGRPGGKRHGGPIQLNDLTAMMLNAANPDAGSKDQVAQHLPDAIDPGPAVWGGPGPRRDVALHAYRNSGLARVTSRSIRRSTARWRPTAGGSWGAITAGPAALTSAEPNSLISPTIRPNATTCGQAPIRRQPKPENVC